MSQREEDEEVGGRFQARKEDSFLQGNVINFSTGG